MTPLGHQLEATLLALPIHKLANHSTSHQAVYCPTPTIKTPDTRHAGGCRYGNGIFHCILGMKGRALFHLAHIEPAEVSFRFILRSKTNSSPNKVRLVCQMLRLILYTFPSFLRLVYQRQPCSGFFSWRSDSRGFLLFTLLVRTRLSL
ncbi:hypothetical protein AVEN_138900-1 [Araneus ventricosus]|uniref:Uncharacterized protein n=1 Tax=Araneus ventricosus TaxID=182803 RepID=A0A4Y2QTY9_ARAVE|nr:hypothetical protein AVEN_138900-1 [Araneus ventricosus]